ncbi:hypothetical protein GCM10009754_85950 [Amycolatopsis minnesotensis]|uniref:Uncharacterized protein n=1 Tax=Amycolatopsis minnesotensis TaxID=337894 RepID=A0ABP5ECQ5_9PSEU
MLPPLKLAVCEVGAVTGKVIPMDNERAWYDRVMAWQHAYQEYAQAWQEMNVEPRSDATIRRFIAVSREVAHAWRQLARADRTASWWILAAGESSAAAFDDQARLWEAEESNDPVFVGMAWFGDGLDPRPAPIQRLSGPARRGPGGDHRRTGGNRGEL